MTCYRFDNDDHTRSTSCIRFQVVSYTRCKNCETGVCLHAATLLYTCTMIPDTLLIRDCGTRIYALRFTNGQSLQWSEYYLKLASCCALQPLLCGVSFYFVASSCTILCTFRLPPPLPHYCDTHAALLRFATFFENDLLPVR